MLFLTQTDWRLSPCEADFANSPVEQVFSPHPARLPPPSREMPHRVGISKTKGKRRNDCSSTWRWCPPTSTYHYPFPFVRHKRTQNWINANNKVLCIVNMNNWMLNILRDQLSASFITWMNVYNVHDSQAFLFSLIFTRFLPLHSFIFFECLGAFWHFFFFLLCPSFGTGISQLTFVCFSLLTPQNCMTRKSSQQVKYSIWYRAERFKNTSERKKVIQK